MRNAQNAKQDYFNITDVASGTGTDRIITSVLGCR
jgi:hypothetical protein